MFSDVRATTMSCTTAASARVPAVLALSCAGTWQLSDCGESPWGYPVRYTVYCTDHLYPLL